MQKNSESMNDDSSAIEKALGKIAYKQSKYSPLQLDCAHDTLV
ncbi:hypothetical protein [Paenibacillus agaridevorans]|nr:hypothetical protein [Paenibacillus agaridevorans]